MRAYIAIAIGGVLGCWARYAMTNLVQAIYGRDFPYATLTINVLACFMMGFLFQETLDRLTINTLGQIPTEVSGVWSGKVQYRLDRLALATFISSSAAYSQYRAEDGRRPAAG